jgi:hypothetical protein
MDLEIRIEQRTEEAETLQMVQVEVAEEDMQLGARCRLQRDAEWTDAGASVQYEDVPARQSDLDA